jgi:hypothetical protein
MKPAKTAALLVHDFHHRCRGVGVRFAEDDDRLLVELCAAALGTESLHVVGPADSAGGAFVDSDRFSNFRLYFRGGLILYQRDEVGAAAYITASCDDEKHGEDNGLAACA